MRIDALVEKYILLRDQIAVEEAAFKEKMAGKKSMLDKVELVIKQHLDATGTDSVTVRGVGTAYTTTRVSASVADWDATLPFIIKNDAWAMLERRVNKTAVQEYLKEKGELPPGVNMSQQVVVNVRRS